MAKSPNLRYELRAYSEPNPCRLAAILRELCWNAGIDSISRDHVVARWARLYPRHVTQTNRRSISSRVVNGLSLLKTAGIAEGQGDNIVILNGELLVLSADNLLIVQDDQGVSLRPGLWKRRPAVPAHLQAISNQLEEKRQASIAAATAESE